MQIQGVGRFFSISAYASGIAIETITNIVEKHKIHKIPYIISFITISSFNSKDIRDYLVEVFTKSLQQHKYHKPERNSQIISLLASLHAKESLDVIREAYIAKSIEKDWGVSFADVLQALEVEIPNDDELISICPHCQKPIEICKKDYEKVNLISKCNLISFSHVIKNSKKRNRKTIFLANFLIAPSLILILML